MREREKEIRVSANRGVDVIYIHSLTTSVGVEPFSSFALFPFVSGPDGQLYEEEIMHHSTTTNFILDAHVLLLVRVYIYIYVCICI